MSRKLPKIVKNLEQWGPIDSKILYVSFWFLPTAGLAKKRTGIDWPTLFGVFKKDRLTFYWDNTGMDKWGNLALKKWLIPDHKRKQLWQEYLKVVHSMKVLAKKIERANLTSGQLASLGQAWYEVMIDFWCVTLVPEIANFAAPANLRRLIANKVPTNRVDHILEVLLAPEALSFHQQSELELLKLKTRDNFRAKLATYTQTWGWVENSYYENKHLPPEYFARQVSKFSRAEVLAKIKKIQNYPAQVKLNKQQVINTSQLPKNIANAAKAMTFSIWWQDHRKALAWWAHEVTEILTRVIGKQKNIAFDDLMHYTAEEWRDLFAKGHTIPKKTLRQRKQFAFAYVINNHYTIHYDRQAKTLAGQWDQTFKKTKSQTLTGIVASRGKGETITGKVCVVHSPRLAGKMKAGDILVAPMTSPDFISAMRKAKAIVTDIGGLMSHAAVVARELGVPCIVGTKTATKIFKNGDTIMIDPSRGIVNKL